MSAGLLWRKYLFAVATMAATASLLIAVRHTVNLTTVALVLVLAVMLTAVWWGSGPALVSALGGLLAFNYFFIPPIHTWVIMDPQNWVALVVFTLTALAVGQLSSRAKRQAEVAEARRAEIEELYHRLQQAFEEAAEAATLRKSEKLKTALLDAVTHDLRTPLTSIKASVTTLLAAGAESGAGKELAGDARRELLLVINEESDRLDRFVEEMMALAQIEGGQLLLRRAPTPVHDVIHAAMERAATCLQPHPVEVTVAQPLPLLLVDPATISGVIFELLENAAKYSPASGRIHITATESAADSVEITVADEGEGVPAALRERVFDKFFRVPGGRRDGQGFGMGLAIARGTVEAHGGRIWMEAGPGGRGTVVRFTLPGQT
jgi:K+-sensing histidine kinase KdpD